MGVFNEIPGHVQVAILRKLEYEEFIKFKQCSKETLTISKNFTHQFPFKVAQITLQGNDSLNIRKSENVFLRQEDLLNEPIRLEAEYLSIEFQSTAHGLTNLSNFCQKTTMKAETLFIVEPPQNFELLDICRLIKPLGIKNLNMQCNNISSSKLDMSQFKELETINLSVIQLEEPDFLALHAPEIVLCESGILPGGLNKFLKQWLEGERRIKKLNVWSFSTDYMGSFNDPKFTVLWSPESHESSPFADLLINSWEQELKKIISMESKDGKKLWVAVTIYEMLGVTAKEYEDIHEIREWIENHFGP